MSKQRVRIYTAEDVAQHCTYDSCWISHGGKVYDVTKFLNDHPGGDDLILGYAGKDIGEVMRDPAEHEHSDSAFDMLEEFVIGRVGVGEVSVSDGEWLLSLYSAVRYVTAWHPRLGPRGRFPPGGDGLGQGL